MEELNSFAFSEIFNENYTTNIIGLVNTLILIIGLVYAGIQLFQIKDSNKKTQDWNKRRTTFDVLTSFSFGEFPNIIRELYEMSGIKIETNTSYAMVAKKIKGKKLYLYNLKLKQLLNVFEGVVVSIKNDIIYDDICYEYAGFIFSLYYNWSLPFIEKRRKESKEPTLYIEFETKAKEWIKKLDDEKKNNQ